MPKIEVWTPKVEPLTSVADMLAMKSKSDQAFGIATAFLVSLGEEMGMVETVSIGWSMRLVPDFGLTIREEKLLNTPYSMQFDIVLNPFHRLRGLDDVLGEAMRVMVRVDLLNKKLYIARDYEYELRGSYSEMDIADDKIGTIALAMRRIAISTIKDALNPVNVRDRKIIAICDGLIAAKVIACGTAIIPES